MKILDWLLEKDLQDDVQYIVSLIYRGGERMFDRTYLSTGSEIKKYIEQKMAPDGFDIDEFEFNIFHLDQFQTEEIDD